MASVIFSSTSSLPFTAAAARSQSPTSSLPFTLINNVTFPARSHSHWLNNKIIIPKFKQSKLSISACSSVFSQVESRDATTGVQDFVPIHYGSGVSTAKKLLNDVFDEFIEMNLLRMPHIALSWIDDIVAYRDDAMGRDDDHADVIKFGKVVCDWPKYFNKRKQYKINKLSMTVPERVKQPNEKKYINLAKSLILETEKALVVLVLMPGVTSEEDIEHFLMSDSLVIGTKKGVSKMSYITSLDLKFPDRFDFNQCAKTILQEGVLKITIQKKLT